MKAGSRSWLIIIVTSVLLVPACGKKSEKEDRKSGQPKKTEPSRGAESMGPTRVGPLSRKGGPGQVSIKPSPQSPGGVAVSTGGKDVWPPKGPGCDKYVACCNAASRVARSVGLACQLTVARQPVDCVKALVTVKAIMTEQGKTPPKACE